MPHHAPTSQPSRWFALLLLLLGSFGIAAAWVIIALARGEQCSWMAMLAALDAVLLLRLARIPSGWPRALSAAIGTSISIVVANWGIAATHIGQLVGLTPWESALRLGPAYAWTLLQLANDGGDLAWFGAALLLATIASR